MSELKENKKLEFLNKPITLWAGLLFGLLAFAGGVLAGGGGQFLDAQIIIKGRSRFYHLSTGNVTNTTAERQLIYRKMLISTFIGDLNIIKSKF